MKKNSLLMIAATILMTACGTVAQHAASSGSAMFEDGIYSSGPSFRSKVEKQESRAETDALVEKTKASAIYLFGDKKDTVMIPENMSASIRYDKEKRNTIVTVGENPYDWHNNINPWAYYTPYSIGSSWYWSRHFDPWYWNSWAYTPWHYSGWYDPWYYGYGGWYDPWYYGGYYGGWYGGWYNPYYGYMYPHYAGWYGGWDPYLGYHHHHIHVGPIKDNNWHGSRHSTGADRTFASKVSVRGGIATSSGTRRSVSASSASRVQTERAATASRRPGRTTASRVQTVTPVRANSVVKTETVNRRPAATSAQNYRRPSGAATVGTATSADRAVSRTPVQRPAQTQSYRNTGSSTYRSNESPTSRSSYTPNTSRSYSTGSSFSTGGSSGRSGGGFSGGGGATRSGGSSSRR